MTRPEDTDRLDGWPNCATPDCEHKACTWSRRPELCFPCAQRVVGREALIEDFNATHDLTWDEAAALDAAEDDERDE